MEIVKNAWWAGVNAVKGDQAVLTALADYRYKSNIAVVAVGKAATSMMEGIIQLGLAFEEALVVTKYDHASESVSAHPRIQYFESAHPVPDTNSLEAGRRLQEFVRRQGEDRHLIVLVSGGASALAEVLIPGYSLADLEEDTQQLLANGEDINAANAYRQKKSLIKAGKLLADCTAKSISVLAISDVPGDNINVIGSGIGVCSRADADVRIIASNAIGRQSIEAFLRQQGVTVIKNEESLYERADTVAEVIANDVKSGAAGAYIYGGEPTLVLPDKPGRGGRNQHLALLLNRLLHGEEVIGLAGGSDGTDGPTGDAGGWVRPQKTDRTLARKYLDTADSGSYLADTGLLLTTGATGTNVMDFVVLIKEA